MISVHRYTIFKTWWQGCRLLFHACWGVITVYRKKARRKLILAKYVILKHFKCQLKYLMLYIMEYRNIRGSYKSRFYFNWPNTFWEHFNTVKITFPPPEFNLLFRNNLKIYYADWNKTYTYKNTRMYLHSVVYNINHLNPFQGFKIIFFFLN